MKKARLSLTGTLILIIPLCPACDKRAELRARLETAKAELVSKQAESDRLQAESDRLSAALPRGVHATEGRVSQLSQENEVLRTELEGLKKEKAAAAEENARLEAEINAYLKTYSKN